MKINWKVRMRNPMFWVGIIMSVLLPILSYFGLNWEDMTTWAALGRLFVEAIKNPVVVVAVVVSVYNAILDPTTKGFSDSAQALTYDKPKEE